MSPLNSVLFGSDLWKTALEKYAEATHVTVKLFDADEGVVLSPIHPTPLFQLFEDKGYDPGLFVECARRCLAQTENRPAVMVSEIYGLAVIGTSLVLEGKIVGAAVAGYAFVDFSQVSEIQHIAREAGIGFDRLWQIAREQKPVPQGRLTVHGELLQVLGDALLKENYRTRQHEQTVVELQEAARAKDEAHHELQQTASALNESEKRLARELSATQQLQWASALLIEGGDADTLYQKIVDAAVHIMRSDMASMQMLDAAQDALKLLAWHGFDETFGETFAFVRPNTNTACRVAWQARHRVIVADVETCDFITGTALDEHRKAGIRAVQSTPLFSRTGHILGMISTHWSTPHTPTESDLRLFDILTRMAADLIEQKRAEATRARLASIVESSEDAIVSKDLNGVIMSWNHGAERLFGYTEKEAIGQSITMLIPADRATEEPQILDRIRRGESIEHYETVRRRKDGRLLDISLTVSPIVDPNGQIVGASKIARDISDRKHAEEELRQSHDHLERIVEQRTASLRELSANLMRLQDDERRKISRELHDATGQDLTGLKLELGAIAREVEKTRPDLAERIAQNAEYAGRIADNLRTMSYLLHPPMLDELGLRSAVNWYVEGFSKRSGIRVTLDLPQEMPRLPDALELVLFRVLQESLTNIHRHSQTKAVEIQIALGSENVTLQIRDYGKGIPAELLKRFRTEGIGVGVGLRSMQGRVSEMGGRFEIQCENKGTLIKAIIPLSEAATKPDAAVGTASGA